MRFLLFVLSVGIVCSCGGSPARPTTTVPATPTGAPADGPSITGVSPDRAVAGSSDMTIRITGANFKAPDRSSRSWTWALWSVNGDVELDTRFVSDTELTAVIPARLLHDAIVAKLSVVTGDPMGWSDGFRRYPRSNAVNFTILSSNSMGVVYSATFTAESRPRASRQEGQTRQRGWK